MGASAYAQNKDSRMEACQWILSCYRSEGKDFLNTVIEDESLVHHYETEMKSQSPVSWTSHK